MEPAPSPRAPIEESLRDSGFRLAWLEREVQILEDKIRFLDELSFKIKGWAVTVWSGLLTLALMQNSWELSCLSVAVLLVFLITDASYKRYQVCFVRRSRDIMRFLNDAAYRGQFTPERPFPLYDLLNIHTRNEHHHPTAQDWGSLTSMAGKASVALVYWALLLVSLLAIVLLAGR